MKAGDKVDFITGGGFTWEEPKELFYGEMVDENRLFIYRKRTNTRAMPLGIEPKGGWCFYDEEIRLRHKKS